MNLKTWLAVDHYFSDCFTPEDEIAKAILANCKRENLPDIQVSSHQAMLLHIFIKMQKAKNVLEIGTLGGYSTIHMARALDDDGHITTIEYDKKHAKVAADNFKQAGLSEKITLINSDGESVLKQMIKEEAPAFDFIFLDADKKSNPIYLELCLQLVRPGSVIICDNIVRNGEVLDENSSDENVQGIRNFCHDISQKSNLITSAIQTVGSKGYDGFSITFIQ